MFTFATTAASAVGVLAAWRDSEMSSTFYGQPCTDADPCSTFDAGSSVGLYGMPRRGRSFRQRTRYRRHDATFIDADGGDAGDDAD